MTYFVIGILAVLIFLCFCGPNSSCGGSLDSHRRYGRYRVLYDDGQLSQPFSLGVARDYAKIFGGRVVPRSYKKS